MSDRRPGPVAAKILSALAEQGDNAWSDLSWADPLTEAQVYGATAHLTRVGLLAQTGERSFALTAVGRAAAHLASAEAAFDEAIAARQVGMLEALEALAALQSVSPDRRDAAMLAARQAGASLVDIGAAVGITREGVRQRLDRITDGPKKQRVKR